MRIAPSDSIYGITLGGPAVPHWLQESADPDLEIRGGRLRKEGEVLWRSAEPPDVECRRHPDGLVLAWAEASYLVSERRIIIDAHDPAHAFERHLNSLLSLVLANRGVPCLHGLVMADSDRSIAILGRSGVGKSTTGRALGDLGFELVTDDLIALDPGGLVRTGPPFIRLESSGPCDELDPGGKRRVPLLVCGAAPPLAGVVLLKPDVVGIQDVTGVEAVDLLLNNVYNPITAVPAHALDKFRMFSELASTVSFKVVGAKYDEPARMAVALAVMFS